MIVIIILLYFLTFLLLWQFVGYPSLMAVIALLSKPTKKDYNYKPFVSILVPAYNEAKVIEERIQNLLGLDYPGDKYEILIVESGSTDNTYQIVENFMEENKISEPTVRLISEENRRGKASAINLGKSYVKGDIVLVTDANSMFDKNVLKEMMPHFAEAKIGGVGGRYIVSNPSNKLASSESFYWDLEYIMREGESVLYSACAFHGEINAWRKDIVSADNRAVAEDLDMAIQIVRAGYYIRYERNAMVYEPSATTRKEQIRQRRRTTVGVIQCIFKHWNYLWLPTNLYSLLIFSSHRILPILSPFILLAVPTLYIVAWDTHVITTHLVVTLFTSALLFGALLLMRLKLIQYRKGGTSISVASIPRIAYYVLLNEYIILLAWKDFILKKYSVTWEKVSR